MALTPQIEKLLHQIDDLHQKEAELIEALRAAVSGELTPGQEAKQALAAFGKAWQRRYRERYVPHYPKEIPLCKRLLASLTLEELTRRMAAYLADGGAYYVERKHPIGLFEQSVNTYAPAPDGPEEDGFLTAPAVGCTHRPPCRSDHEHTGRVMRDLNGHGPRPRA